MPAQIGQYSQQGLNDPVQLLSCVAVVLSQLWWPVGTRQDKHSLTPAPDHMHMGRPMIIGINDNAQALQGQDGRHFSVNLSDWVIFKYFSVFSIGRTILCLPGPAVRGDRQFACVIADDPAVRRESAWVPAFYRVPDAAAVACGRKTARYCIDIPHAPISPKATFRQCNHDIFNSEDIHERNVDSKIMSLYI